MTQSNGGGRMPWHGRLAHAVISFACLLGGVWGCDKNAKQSVEVVLYTSVDEPVARPIVAQFEKRTGIKVILKSDTEATKTAGLAARLEAERDRPRADVWWGNEIFHTIDLAEKGVFEKYEAPAAASIPARFKDEKGRWAATALRARVIAVHTGGQRIAVKSITDLLDAKFKGKVCMARPNAGTTRGHMAALYTLWGPQKTERFLIDLKANGVALLGGNSVVADEVAAGRMLAGLTDNDDVESAAKEGGRIEMVLPDQREQGIGTLLMPCTVALVKGGPNAQAARKLVDYLLSAEVEKTLLEKGFARYSVFEARPIRAMEVDYAKVAQNLKVASDLALKVLEGR